MRAMLLTGILSVGVFACGEKTEDTGATEVETGVSGEPDLANGQTIHDSMCMACHASNPDMANNTAGLSDAELESVIQNGSGSMPGQGLSADDLRDVIAYLRETYGG